MTESMTENCPEAAKPSRTIRFPIVMLQLLVKRLSDCSVSKGCSLYPQDQTADLLQRSFWTERPLWQVIFMHTLKRLQMLFLYKQQLEERPVEPVMKFWGSMVWWLFV